jgi:2'-5' RNA ligase
MARDRASRPEAKPLRLFVAVDLPDDVRESLETSVAPLRERFPRARWVPSGNQHVTLKFLGATWPRLVDWVQEAVGRVAADHASFDTRVTGLGAFPSSRRARVLWTGLHDPEDRLAAIAGSLDDALAKEFAREKRAFTPHLTIARFDPPVPLGEGLEGVTVESRSFAIGHLTVYRSYLQRPAPVYEDLATFPLGPSDA